MRLNVKHSDWEITIMCLSQAVTFIVSFKMTKKL